MEQYLYLTRDSQKEGILTEHDVLITASAMLSLDKKPGECIRIDCTKIAVGLVQKGPHEYCLMNGMELSLKSEIIRAVPMLRTGNIYEPVENICRQAENGPFINDCVAWLLRHFMSSWAYTLTKKGLYFSKEHGWTPPKENSIAAHKDLHAAIHENLYIPNMGDMDNRDIIICSINEISTIAKQLNIKCREAICIKTEAIKSLLVPVETGIGYRFADGINIDRFHITDIKGICPEPCLFVDSKWTKASVFKIDRQLIVRCTNAMDEWRSFVVDNPQFGIVIDENGDYRTIEEYPVFNFDTDILQKAGFEQS